MADPQLPFFIQWASDPDQHPSVGARGDVSLAGLDMVGDPAVVSEWIGADASLPLGDVSVAWSSPDGEREPGIASVRFSTPHGDVVLD